MSLQIDFSDLEETIQKLIEQVNNPPWSVTITRIGNGYTLRGTDINDVIEDNENDELKSHEELLWAIMKHFNFGGSKHSPERIRIIREKQ